VIETAAFLEVFSKWKTNVGDCLAREEPQILARMVELSSIREGISQRALQQDLKINQSRLSKLTKKLAACKWVVLRKLSSDRRVLLMTATALAKTKVDWLRKELSAIDAVPSRATPTSRTAFKVPKEQKSLFEDD
jgi:DNA-binding MarR family transcriptional regulator